MVILTLAERVFYTVMDGKNYYVVNLQKYGTGGIIWKRKHG